MPKQRQTYQVSTAPATIELEAICPVFRITDLMGNKARIWFAIPARSLDKQAGQKDDVLSRGLLGEFPRLGGDPRDLISWNRSREIWDPAKWENTVAELTDAFTPADRVKVVRPSPRGILREMSQARDVDSIVGYTRDLAGRLHLPDTRHAVRERVTNADGSMPPLQRRALLETLLEIGDEQAPNLAFEGLVDALDKGAVDEYVVGCVSALRRSRSVGVGPEAIREVLRRWLRELLPVSEVRDRAGRALLREVVLAIGVYGCVQEVETLIGMLEDDLDYEFGDQITHSLGRLLARDPEGAGEGVTSKLCNLGRELLSGWIAPRVLHNPAIFAQASQVISVLCARLEPRETRVAYTAVQDAGDRSLALRMRQHMMRWREALSARGHESWLSRVDGPAKEIEVELQALAVASP